MKKNLFLLIALVVSLSASSQQFARGYVYNDANKNNKKDRREAGIPNVAVSNGSDVTLTDAKGFYSLPVSNDNTIFVIKPSGYQLPVDDIFIPKFYYHYKPSGSPDSLMYKGISPTGKLPKSIDFALYKYDEPEDYSVIVFGDPQPYSVQDLDYFSRKIVNDVKKTDRVLFGISLGDLVGDNLDLRPVYKQRVAKLQLPWYNVMGNHDMNYDVQSDILSDETFQKDFGTPNYAFNYGDAHFIILDDILYPDPRDGKGYWGGFRADQLNFVENDLKYVPKNKLVIVSLHIQLDHTEDGFRYSDRQRLFDLLKDYENVLVMSAHTHLQKQSFFTEEQGWQGAKPLHEFNAGTTSGDWYSGKSDANGNPDATMRDGTPQGYSFLNIKGNQYDIDYKVAGANDDYQMNIYAPKVVPYKGRTTSQIVVNFFMGSKMDIVEYKIDNDQWRKMRYIETTDPNYLLKLIEWDVTYTLLPGRRPSNPENSTHLWTAGLQLNLEPGEHTIYVRATDMFGKVHHGEKTYMILKE